METISSHLFKRKLWVTFWDLWHRRDRGEASATFSSLTVTTRQNSSPISSRTTITSQLSLHAQTGLQSSFGREWVLQPCLRPHLMSLCRFTCFSFYTFFASVDVVGRSGHDTAKLATWCLHAQGIALLFHCLIISCSNNRNGEWAAIETCASWGHNACNKYTCKSILSQPCTASCNWWFINMSMASNHPLYRVACREKHSLTSHTVPLLQVTVGSVQQNLFNNSSAGLEGWDPHVGHNEEGHDTKLRPGTHSPLVISRRRVMNLNDLTWAERDKFSETGLESTHRDI